MSKPTTNPFARILLATDGSPNSQQAAAVAAQVAKSYDSEVTVMSAIPSISGKAAPLEGEYYSRLINKADDNVDKAAAVFKRSGVSVSEKEIPQDRASVVETIVEYASEEKIGLIVMGTRGLGGFRRAAMGSVSSGVSEHAPCATLVVRPRGKKEDEGLVIKRILVAVDGSQNSQRALEAAVDLAKHLKAELRIAHVVYVPTLFWSMGVPGSAVPTDKIEEDAEERGARAAGQGDEVREGRGGLEREGRARHRPCLTVPGDSPASGARRRRPDSGGYSRQRRVQEAPPGSVANSVLHYAGCSVLVTK